MAVHLLHTHCRFLLFLCYCLLLVFIQHKCRELEAQFRTFYKICVLKVSGCVRSDTASAANGSASVPHFCPFFKYLKKRGTHCIYLLYLICPKHLHISMGSKKQKDRKENNCLAPISHMNWNVITISVLSFCLVRYEKSKCWFDLF